VSGADVAETTFTVFASNKRHARQVRLVVRRVRPTLGSQLALFTAWDYHAFITDLDLPLAELEADHGRHAVVEQTTAELNSAGLAHLPSGSFTANVAWLSLTVMAHNLGRAVGILAGAELERATAATLRPKVITLPAGSSTAAADGTSDCPPTGPVPTRSRRADLDPRHPTALLTNNRARRAGPRRSRADRQLPHALQQPATATAVGSTPPTEASRSTVDPA